MLVAAAAFTASTTGHRFTFRRLSDSTTNAATTGMHVRRRRRRRRWTTAVIGTTITATTLYRADVRASRRWW